MRARIEAVAPALRRAERAHALVGVDGEEEVEVPSGLGDGERVVSRVVEAAVPREMTHDGAERRGDGGRAVATARVHHDDGVDEGPKRRQAVVEMVRLVTDDEDGDDTDRGR